MGRYLTASFLFAALTSVVLADIACSPSSQCPQDMPCCSQYGSCGTGAYCLGGCDPVSSFSLEACVPAPICKSATYNFSSLEGLESNTKYLGDASTADWVYSGEPTEYSDSVLLTMAQGTVGTLLASSHYVWYGKIGARFKTSAGAGVVTAFILLGDTKDEIDFEFVGTDLLTAQTNFYSQGVTNYDNGKNTTIPSNSLENFHDYEIDWQPDTLTWSIDGQVVRTLNRDDTWNATANRWFYPQTPARVQLSLWPAGLSTNPEGTIEWAGGVISWNSPYMTNGYYYSQFDSVSIQCYDPPSGANVQGTNSYIITDKAMTNTSIEVTNDKTVLASFEATGLNMSAGNTTSSQNGGSTNNTVPGLQGGGGGADSNRGATSSSGSATATATGSASTGFVQGGKSGASSNIQAEKVLSGSLFAAIVAIVGLCVL